MKTISTWNNRSIWIAIALFLTLVAAGSRGVLADPGAAELVREAAAICRQVPDGKAEVGKSDARPEYDRIIASVNRSMLADLQAISKSDAYPKLERRLAAILCRRIEHPEEFAKIQPYLTPVRNEYERLGPPRASMRWRVPIRLRPIDDPDLLAPRLRVIVEQNRKLYDELLSAFLQMQEELKRLPDGDAESLKRIERRFHEQVRTIGKQYQAKDSDVAALAGAIAYPSADYDPKYAPAWEEALCRSRSPDLKWQLMEVVAALRVPDSAPIVASQLRLGLQTGDRKLSGSSLCFFFFSDPTETLVDELHDCLQELPAPERAKAEQEMRNYVSGTPRWQRFLSNLKSDPKWASKVAPLVGGTDTATAPGG
ncbi:MAG: hypothetical protein ACUVXJ_18275 [Phycisphaerae bacterium]